VGSMIKIFSINQPLGWMKLPASAEKMPEEFGNSKIK
jgi:hypothetical protein